MKCPECGSNIMNMCCLNCGYLLNGEKISLNDKEDKHLNEKLYNKKYDVMNRNQNSLFPFIFGGFYIAYHGHIFIALLIEIIETCLVKALTILTHCFVILYLYRTALYILLILTSRMIIAAIANGICLYLDKKRIKKVIKKHPKDYRQKLYKHHNFGIACLLINIALYLAIYMLIFTSTFN